VPVSGAGAPPQTVRSSRHARQRSTGVFAFLHS
jgi:hypothetical protein